MKKLLISAVTFIICIAASASGQQAKADSPAKEHLQNHFKLYGFIRNYFAFDTRESVSGTGNLFYYLPKDKSLDASGEDLNQQASFRFLALTSRVGLDVSGYYMNNVHFGAKVEADFYSGLSGSTGTAAMRLRQAYATITWKDLPLSDQEKASVGLKIGQAWHPMAADFPHVFSLEVGNPFGPFSRTPQVAMDANLGGNWTITASALWQMQYASMGPSWNKEKLKYEAAASADYIKYSCVPEMYAGVTYKNKGFLARAGVDMLSITPRTQNMKKVDEKYVASKVKERITTVSPFAYVQYNKGLFSVRAKTIYAQGGEHFNLMSGYVKVGENEDGSWEYAPLRNSSSWLSLSYGKKWQGVLFLGYMKNLGLAEGVSDDPVASGDIYFFKNGFSNMTQMYRINPELIYNIGKLNLGIEYQYTAVEYGKTFNERALVTEDLHWVGNHRVQMMVKFNF
jgi:hypothetical protein